MSIACELSNPNSKKTKAEKRITTKILLIRVLCGLVVIWLCSSLSSGFLCICKKKESASDDESSSSAKGMLFRNQKNVSRSEIDAMLSLFFDSNQVTSFECRKESDGITCSLSTRSEKEEDEEEEAKRHVVAELMSSSDNEEEGGVLREVVLFYVMNKWHWWLVLCVLLVGGGRMIFARKEVSSFVQDKQQQQQQCKRAGKWSKNMLLLCIIAGVSLSVLWFWDTNEEILFQRKETLTNMCEERARVLQDQFNVSMNHVHALSILVSTFHHGKTPSAIDQKTFGEYTERTNFERPLTSGVAYALKVTHSEREKFEKEHGWSIKKMDFEDQTLVQGFDPAPVQDEYAPVIFAQETVSHIVSVDMMSGKEDRENILRARALGKGVLTSPFQLLKSNHLGVILTFAVYNTNLPHDATEEERIQATIGYLGASYDMPSLVEKLLQQLASKQTISVNVYDTTNASSVIKMYGSEVGDMSEEHISSLDFGDPLGSMRCTAGFALVITFLLGHIFNGAINRIATVEEDYQKMMELKARAEAADVAKSQFLATVSHEIRTPMWKDLISLINEVLDQAKIESGRLELENVPFDLRFLLDNVSSLLSGKAAEKGIELAVYVSSNVPAVIVGDPVHTGKGHIFISVHLTNEVREPFETEDEILKQRLGSDETSCNTLSGYPAVNASGSWRNFKTFQDHSCDKTELLVTVEDTGVGIPVDAQSRIFTPFMQADSSTSRTYGGTGIGLSISKRLVELMQGEIGFVSKPGVGTTFSFTGVFGERERDSSVAALELFDQSIQEFQGLKALVIDSRNIRAEVTRYHLQRVGVSSVDIASSLATASTSCASKLVNLDLILIDKDAWNKEEYVAFNSGQETSTRPPKIVLLATFTTPAELSEIKSSGLVDEVVMKPLRMSVLICCLQETMGSGKQILVVDDTMVNRRVADAVLRKYGALVTCVDSGKAAVAMLKPPHDFHACFMDLQMPEMDGFEATRRVRDLEEEMNKKEESRKWHTPILAMTADVIQATNEKCIKCGMDGFVSKPFEEEELYSSVARFFDK
ncbi:hypothetical protein Bca52824_040651 [Brassica carinata]|uniref:histidine kinase n=1 Tax=Brassica carinata TaxID=52824 RepID=A0A8X7RTU1_BRACI|nr:hypothetical protein Bca52824_040651 [Brassica carinata]